MSLLYYDPSMWMDTTFFFLASTHPVARSSFIHFVWKWKIDRDRLTASPSPESVVPSNVNLPLILSYQHQFIFPNPPHFPSRWVEKSSLLATGFSPLPSSVFFIL